MRIIKRILLLLVIVSLITLALTYLWFSHTYSEGNRAGTLVKISERGYVFKTYEGALNTNPLGAIMSNTPNPNNGMWEFSVADDAIYKQLQQYEGRKVRLHYKEIIKNMPWQGDTRYFVDGVEEVEEHNHQQQPATVPPPTTTNPTQTTTPPPATDPQQQQQQNPATTTHP